MIRRATGKSMCDKLCDRLDRYHENLELDFIEDI